MVAEGSVQDLSFGAFLWPFFYWNFLGFADFGLSFWGLGGRYWIWFPLVWGAIDCEWGLDVPC